MISLWTLSERKKGGIDIIPLHARVEATCKRREQQSGACAREKPYKYTLRARPQRARLKVIVCALWTAGASAKISVTTARFNWEIPASARHGQMIKIYRFRDDCVFVWRGRAEVRGVGVFRYDVLLFRYFIGCNIIIILQNNSLVIV